MMGGHVLWLSFHLTSFKVLHRISLLHQKSPLSLFKTGVQQYYISNIPVTMCQGNLDQIVIVYFSLDNISTSEEHLITFQNRSTTENLIWKICLTMCLSNLGQIPCSTQYSSRESCPTVQWTVIKLWQFQRSVTVALAMRAVVTKWLSNARRTFKSWTKFRKCYSVQATVQAWQKYCSNLTDKP